MRAVLWFLIGLLGFRMIAETRYALAQRDWLRLWQLRDSVDWVYACSYIPQDVQWRMVVATLIMGASEWDDGFLGGLPVPVLHLFACDCAERALLGERAAGREPDSRSWAAVLAKCSYLCGETTKEALKRAEEAAMMVSMSAYSDFRRAEREAARVSQQEPDSAEASALRALSDMRFAARTTALSCVAAASDEGLEGVRAAALCSVSAAVWRARESEGVEKVERDWQRRRLAFLVMQANSMF